MTDSAKAFVESSTKAAVTAKVAEADRLENQLARERRSRKELAIATAAMGMKRLDDPTDPYWQVAFATANGMGAALTAGYSRDYFSGNGAPKPMT